jgi:hypothetical protein
MRYPICPIQGVTGALSPGVKRPGRAADHSHVVPRSRMVELYFHSFISLQRVVLNYLSTETLHLTQILRERGEIKTSCLFFVPFCYFTSFYLPYPLASLILLSFPLSPPSFAFVPYPSSFSFYRSCPFSFSSSFRLSPFHSFTIPFNLLYSSPIHPLRSSFRNIPLNSVPGAWAAGCSTPKLGMRLRIRVS